MNEEQEQNAQNLGLLALRSMLAVVFVYHGSQKLFGAFGGPGLEGFSGWLGSLGIPFPYVNVVLAGSAEFFGGLALASGVLFRWATIPLAFTMFVAAFTAHTGFNAATGGMEYPLTLGVAVVALGLIGPGTWVLAAAEPTVLRVPARAGA